MERALLLKLNASTALFKVTSTVWFETSIMGPLKVELPDTIRLPSVVIVPS